MMLLFSLAQGDTVVDCFEVSTSQPLLSQGKAYLLYLWLVQLLFLVSDLSFSFLLQWVTVWQTPQHEVLPWYPRCRWMSCLAKWCVCCSWQTAASCLSAIKSLARCDRRPVTHVCNVFCTLALVFSCVHVCLAAFKSGVSWRPLPRYSGFNSSHVCGGVVAGREQAGKVSLLRV